MLAVAKFFLVLGQLPFEFVRQQIDAAQRIGAGFLRDEILRPGGFDDHLDDGMITLPVEHDLNRVYATGHSNGSMMAHRVAAEAADLLAAIAPYAGAPYFDLLGFAPNGSMPVLHIHSVDDPRALYDGGLGPPFPLTGVRTQMNPVERELDRWIVHNGCPSTPDTGTTIVGAVGTISEGHTTR